MRTGDWAEPWDPANPADVEACTRKIEFAISWFADPIYFGHYPESMRKQLKDLLPEFTPKEAEPVKGAKLYSGVKREGDRFGSRNRNSRLMLRSLNFKTSFLADGGGHPCRVCDSMPENVFLPLLDFMGVGTHVGMAIMPGT